MFNHSEVTVLTKQTDATENIHLISLCYTGG